ncbi:MAG: polysaccharide deacetylase family protein [Planctomycetes bacterium]|nr:polysaccharide deacetylase family protein [Planctomycetota bacterium]
MQGTRSRRGAKGLSGLWVCWLFCWQMLTGASALEPIPERLVVLTFDDSAKTHFTNVRSLLLELGFGATFFVTEGFDFRENKGDYMTWEEIAQLHRDGFEIGNHSRDHLAMTAQNLADYDVQLAAIDDACQRHGIPRPVSFAYPGNAIDRNALAVLRRHGIRFARRGGAPEFDYKSGRGVAYEPRLDDPLLIPSAGDARPDWTLQDLERAVSLARGGRVAVLQFHGVPDTAHDWVTTPLGLFEQYMRYLQRSGFRVIAMRDLARYVDPDIHPSDPWGPIEDRRERLANSLPLEEIREPQGEAETSYWLRVMADHGFSRVDIQAATGWSMERIERELRSADVVLTGTTANRADSIHVLPYPGGRHPRAAFLDGAIRPQRETKVSVFPPWDDGGYVVVDVPEAIWIDAVPKRQLLYLAHTHIPTLWSKNGQAMEPLEWQRGEPNRLTMTRTLPNRVRINTVVSYDRQSLRMELELHNATSQMLTGLVVQNCVMLAAARDFASVEPKRIRIEKSLIACGNADGNRWVITGWRPTVRTWANPPCPCIHSDPQIPDCPPGESRSVSGWLSFYRGDDIESELQRLSELRWAP